MLSVCVFVSDCVGLGSTVIVLPIVSERNCEQVKTAPEECLQHKIHGCVTRSTRKYEAMVSYLEIV